MIKRFYSERLKYIFNIQIGDALVFREKNKLDRKKVKGIYKHHVVVEAGYWVESYSYNYILSEGVKILRKGSYKR